LRAKKRMPKMDAIWMRIRILVEEKVSEKVASKRKSPAPIPIKKKWAPIARSKKTSMRRLLPDKKRTKVWRQHQMTKGYSIKRRS